MNSPAYQVAMLWAGDAEARRTMELDQTRLAAIAQALRAVGITPQAAVYSDDFVDEVRDQLLQLDGVLVWVDPIVNGRDRTVLDALLREVSDAGVLVSAHPDLILKMGTKEVLYRTRDMGWGSDTRIYRTPDALRTQLPVSLARGEPRVLKQYRGNGGNGVWKVERSNNADVRVRHAQRGSVEEVMTFDAFLTRCEGYFAGEGRIIDQAYQARLPDGMVRCYLVRDRVAGFGEQLINALLPAPAGAPPADAPSPGPRRYFPPSREDLQRLRARTETDWVPALCQTLAIEPATLPIIWDADFLYGPKDAAGDDTYVLCEINISAVYPFPDDALLPLARETLARLTARHTL